MIRRMFLLLLIGAFVLEAWLFLLVGERVGLLASLAWVLASFFLGLVLIRIEGLRMLYGIHIQLQRGVLPTREVLSGLAVVLGGFLLALPGYLTDTFGLMLLLPPTRAALLYCLVRSFDSRLAGQPDTDCGVPPSEEVVEMPAHPTGREP